MWVQKQIHPDKRHSNDFIRLFFVNLTPDRYIKSKDRKEMLKFQVFSISMSTKLQNWEDKTQKENQMLLTFDIVIKLIFVKRKIGKISFQINSSFSFQPYVKRRTSGMTLSWFVFDPPWDSFRYNIILYFLACFFSPSQYFFALPFFNEWHTEESRNENGI